MNWPLLFSYVISGFFATVVIMYGWIKLLNMQANSKNYKVYIAFIILVIMGLISNCFVPTYLKLPLMTSSFTIINYFFFSRNFVKCIASVLLTIGVSLLAEITIVLIGSIFMGDYVQILMNQAHGIIIANFIFCVVTFFVIRTKLIYNLYNQLTILLNRIKKNSIVLFCATTIVILSLFLIIDYMSLPRIAVLSIHSILLIFYVVVIIRLLVVHSKMKTINSKYEMSLSSLKSFENVMNQYRIDNHENKNQLLTIRNMIKSKDKKTIDYIDKIVDNKIKDNESVYYKTFKIPEGGLRATIYPKLAEMRELHINYALDVASDVSTLDLININDDTMLNSCKIIGVFLDNAIDAVKNLKVKKIVIEIYIMDDALCIDIGNNYKGPLDMEKISNAGYTTKGDNRGYGLALVSKIIKNDDHLENEKLLTKNKFTQRLKIKM